MKLKTFLENINELVKENPNLLELDVISAKDDEGNGFDKVHFEPSIGHYFEDDKDFSSHKEDYEEYGVNAICIN